MPPRFAQLFRVGTSISGFLPVGGNSARLMENSDAGIDAIVADIDAAETTSTCSSTSGSPDNNGVKVVEALKRAAARGVTCRAMADGLGSRLMIKLAALAGDGRGRRQARPRAADRHLAGAAAARAGSTCATTARSW